MCVCVCVCVCVHTLVVNYATISSSIGSFTNHNTSGKSGTTDQIVPKLRNHHHVHQCGNTNIIVRASHNVGLHRINL